MNKVVVGLLLMVSLSANAADFTVELVPAPGSVQFSDVANKPATFPPSTHAHAISDVTNLQSELNSKVSAASVVDQAGSIMAFAGPAQPEH